MLNKKHITQIGLTIGGTPVQTPGGISHIKPETAGPFGQNLLQLSISLMLISAVVFSVFFLIWGGISWILSGGDPKAIEGAKARIMYAIIGLFVVLLSFLVISIIGYIFGVSLLGAPPLPRGEAT